MPNIIATPFEARALAQGRLSAFVRPVKPQPGPGQWIGNVCPPGETTLQHVLINDPAHGAIHQIIKGPFGRPGDVLAVRETWIPNNNTDSDNCGGAEYFADYYGAACQALITWRSGATMPARFVRWHLPVGSVAVKRAWTITENEARACGVRLLKSWWAIDDGEATYHMETATEALSGAHDSHWAKRGYPWSGNPWVWFARAEVKS